MRPWWAITLLFVAGLPGCSTLKPPAELDSVGRRALRAIEAADSAALGQLADESLPTSAADDDYRAVALPLSAWAPDSVALVGWTVSVTGQTRDAQLTYELHGRQGWGGMSRNPQMQRTGLKL